MKRDYERYVFFTIGLRRDAATYEALLADAASNSVKQLPTLITIRLGDYYTLLSLLQAGPPAALPAFPQEGSSALHAHTRQEAKHVWSPVTLTELTANADAALTAWNEE
jgi:hypothetical protein